MDTLAKETMGLPIFICPTNHQIISSGTSASSHSTTTNATNTTSATSTSTSTSSNPSPTTPFFATATPTRSPTTPTFPPTATSFLPLTTATPNSNGTAQTHQRRNTYTPPTFTPSTRRESILSPHRLSQAFDFASALAVGVLAKAADSVFGEGQGVQEGIWGEDLESGEREKERGKEIERQRYRRFGDEGGFEGWLD